MDTGQTSSGAVAGKRRRRRAERYPAAVKCTAPRRDGQPCGRLALRGAHVCGVHGGQLPNVRKAAARTVDDARQRLKLLHDPAVDTLGQLMEDRDPRVRLGAVSLLHKVSPVEAPQRGGVDVTVVVSPAEVIRQRLNALREAQQRPAPSIAPEALPWDGEPVEGELLDGDAAPDDLSDATGWL
jgi:hypothetical protein